MLFRIGPALIINQQLTLRCIVVCVYLHDTLTKRDKVHGYLPLLNKPSVISPLVGQIYI